MSSVARSIVTMIDNVLMDESTFNNLYIPHRDDHVSSIR